MATLNEEILLLIRKSNDPALLENWERYSPISFSIDYPLDVKYVNDFLRIQLGLLDCDTYRLRECLVNEPVMEDWLSGFEEEILPFLHNNPLPVWSSNLGAKYYYG